MSVKIDYYGLTDVGRKREKNEDSLFVNGDLGLFMVADGMGGHLGGEFASRLAVKTVGDLLHQLIQDPEATLKRDIGIDRSSPGEILKYAIRYASECIYEEAKQNVQLRGMGTTSVALLIRDNQGFIANVGDSRLYLVRDSGIQQITLDHSLVAEQLRAGVITLEESKSHKFKNIITRSVGFQPEVEVDLVVRDIEVGDRFVLGSDGLTNMVSNDEIFNIASKLPPKEACQKLIELANKNGGDDNVTVVVVSVLAD